RSPLPALFCGESSRADTSLVACCLACDGFYIRDRFGPGVAPLVTRGSTSVLVGVAHLSPLGISADNHGLHPSPPPRQAWTSGKDPHEPRATGDLLVGSGGHSGGGCLPSAHVPELQ